MKAPPIKTIIIGVRPVGLGRGGQQNVIPTRSGMKLFNSTKIKCHLFRFVSFLCDIDSFPLCFVSI